MEVAVEEKRRTYKEWLQRGTVEAYERCNTKRVEVKCKVKADRKRADVWWGRNLSEWG